MNNEGFFKNEDYLVIISENPVRSQFSNSKKEFYVTIDKSRLSAEDSSEESPDLYSGDINFK